MRAMLVMAAEMMMAAALVATMTTKMWTRMWWRYSTSPRSVKACRRQRFSKSTTIGKRLCNKNWLKEKKKSVNNLCSMWHTGIGTKSLIHETATKQTTTTKNTINK